MSTLWRNISCYFMLGMDFGNSVEPQSQKEGIDKNQASQHFASIQFSILYFVHRSIKNNNTNLTI